jgi:Leucine-rich repeat (LRR) protein
MIKDEDDQQMVQLLLRRLHKVSRGCQDIVRGNLLQLSLHTLGKLSRSKPWPVMRAASSLTSITLRSTQLLEFSSEAPEDIRTAAGRQLRRLHIMALDAAAAAAAADLDALAAVLGICSSIMDLTLEGEGFSATRLLPQVTSSQAICQRLQQLQLVGVGGAVGNNTLSQLSEAPGLVSLSINGQEPSSFAPEPTPLQLPPDALSSLHPLTKLCLDRVTFKEGPMALGSVTGLLHLELTHNKDLTTLPAPLASMEHLTLLDLSHSSVKQLPEDLGATLPSLVVLRVEGCRELVALPPSLTSVTRLHAANAGRDHQWSVDNMTGLIALDLGATAKLSRIPVANGKPKLPTALKLAAHTRLQAVHLCGSFFDIKDQELPAELPVRPQLQKLVVDNGRTSSRHIQMAHLLRLYDLQHITHLAFHAVLHQADTEQLGHLGALPRLRRLELINSRLTNLAPLHEWLASCPRLVHVSLKGNMELKSAAELTHLPRQLVRLDVTKCGLQGEVVGVLGVFTRLQLLLAWEGNKWSKPQLQPLTAMLPNLASTDFLVLAEGS